MIIIFLVVFLKAYSRECTQFSAQICADNVPLTLQKDALPGVIGLWSFDKIQMGLDSSSIGNDIEVPPLAGPGLGGIDHSAYYTSDNYTIIPHNDEYSLKVLTISLWVFPLSSSPQFTTILRKAIENSDYTPSIVLWPTQDEAGIGGGQLEILVSTSSGKEGTRSRSSIPGRRWSSLVIVLQHNILQFFLNGNLDSQITLQSLPIHNKGPFYIGGDPWFPGSQMYIDEITIYNKALLQSDILKISRLPGQINQRVIYLGCDVCSYHQAITSCKSGWHLCSVQEIYAGVYQYARNQGWIRVAMDIWGRIDEMDEQLVKNYLDPKISKAGICCQDLFY